VTLAARPVRFSPRVKVGEGGGPRWVRVYVALRYRDLVAGLNRWRLCTYIDGKVANRTLSDFGWGGMSSRDRFATPADFRRHDCTPYRGLHERRESLGVVHRSRTIFCRPLLSLRFAPFARLSLRFASRSPPTPTCPLGSLVSPSPPTPTCPLGSLVSPSPSRRLSASTLGLSIIVLPSMKTLTHAESIRLSK
jgi:hypothetical protein